MPASRGYVLTPSGDLMAASVDSEAGATVKKQTVEACPPVILTEFNFTRPNDTTAYAAGDAVTNSTSAPTALTVAGVARSLGGSGIIRRAEMIDSVNAGTKGQFELWLFSGAAAPTPDNDNAAFTPTDAELLKFVGKIVFHSNNAFVGDTTSNAIFDGTQSGGADAPRALDMDFTCDPTLTNLWGLLVVRNAYTPSANENFAFRLYIQPS